MLRNLSVDFFVILFMLGHFNFIPNHILVLVIFAWFFDAFAEYFILIDPKMAKRNPDLKNFVDVYTKYTKPFKTDAPVLFFLDRVGVASICTIIVMYYYYLHGLC